MVLKRSGLKKGEPSWLWKDRWLLKSLLMTENENVRIKIFMRKL